MVEHQDFEFSNLDKVLFPEDGITKGDLIEYYRKVSSVILPHLQGRPVTLQRFPDGINKESFYQKDVPEYFPQWIDTATLEKKEGELQALICNDQATLLYVANLASVTLHTGLSLVDKVYHPDQMVFDLDPSGNNFNTVRSSALLLKDLLEELGLKPFVKTTGSRGLHVLVPLDSSANFDEVRAFSKEVAGLLVHRDPEHLTTEHRKMGRKGRVFIDILRNAYGQTAVAPYSVRASRGAPIATPIGWNEVLDPGLGPQRYTMTNIFHRLGKIGDWWADIRRHAVSLDYAERKLEELLSNIK